MNLVQHAESGVGAAWLMATVGNTAPHKKLSKKEITSICIPRACQAVGNPRDKQISLRMAANLMYGLTLIHRHQVNYMFEDVNSVHSKLTRPVYFDRFFGGENTKSQPKQRAHVPLPDCPDFIIGDFDRWEDEWFQDPTEKVGRFESIQECLDNYVTHAERADALDKSLYDILEQTMATIRGHDTTYGDVDFELDANGEIVEGGQLLNYNSTLNIDFDESFGPLERVDTEISKSLNRDHTSRDPHFSTTSNPFRSTTLEHRVGRPKRKVVLVDRETAYTDEAFGLSLYTRQYMVDNLLADERSFKKPKRLSQWEILTEISSGTPKYLNYAMNLMLQPPLGTIPNSVLPQLFGDQDVETGRNLQISKDAIEIARARAGLDVLDFDPDDMFDSLELSEVQLGSEDASFQFPSSQIESQGSVGRNLHKLALKFLGYIKKRSSEYGTMCDYYGQVKEFSSQEYRKIEFTSLLPPNPLGASDVPVNKKLAAKSFATVLELATKNAIYIVQGDSSAVEEACILHAY